MKTAGFTEEHGDFALEANRVDFHLALLAFFERHLNAQRQPTAASDSAG